jgi:hypothetical protein
LFFVESCELYEQREVELAELFSPTFRPLLVAIRRQKFTRVEVEGCLIDVRVSGAAGAHRRLLKGVYVNPQVACRAQDERFFVGCQVAGTLR